MKKITALFITFIIFLSTTVLAREVDDFDYDGIENSHSVYLSHLDRDQYGNFRQIKTEAKLYFDNESKKLAEALNINVNMNGADIGMTAQTNTNVLSLLKLRSVDRWFSENTLNVFMEVDLKFIDNLNGLVRPFSEPLQNLNVLDDFVSFTSGKIFNDQYINAKVQVFRKKVLAKDELVFEKIFSNKDITITDFGSVQSLVTIDLNPFISKLERGKKHIVKVTLAPNFGKWRPFSANQAELFKSPEMVNTETDFRYSK